MIEESRKFIDKSRTKQRERPKGCIIYSPHCLRMPKTFVGREGILYTYIGVGAFSVVRFRLVGQCESLSIMKRATEWLYAFFRMYQPKKQLLNDATEPLLNVFPMNKVFKESIKNVQNWKKIVLSMLFVLFTVLSSIAQSVEVETNADRKDFPQQIKGWEWIVFDERNELTTTYPITLKYSSYPSHPQYKVIDRAIYAEDGTLAGIVYCLRYKQAFEDSNLIKESIDNFIDQEHKNQFSKFIDKGDWKKDVITLIKSSSLPEGFYIQNPRPGDTVEDNLLRVPAQFDSIQQLYENGNGFDSWGCPLFSVLKDKGEGKGYQQETVDGSKVYATYSLSEEDMKSLTKYIDELNQKSTYFSFDIIEGEISNTVYCKIKSIPKEQQQDYGTEKTEILKNNWAQFVRPNVYSELKDVEEATQKLTQTLAVSRTESTYKKCLREE